LISSGESFAAVCVAEAETWACAGFVAAEQQDPANIKQNKTRIRGNPPRRAVSAYKLMSFADVIDARFSFVRTR
jgi:hypothetical protein